MDKALEDIAKYYGVEVTEGPGSIIIDKTGAERPVNESDVIEIFGLSAFQTNIETSVAWDSVEKTMFDKDLQWRVKATDSKFGSDCLEVA